MFSDKLIASLKDDNDELITDQQQIMNRIVDYYREVFKKRPSDRLSEKFMENIHINPRPAGGGANIAPPAGVSR